MPVTVRPRFVLVADGKRSYTFSPLSGGEGVEVRFAGPMYSVRVSVVPVGEARARQARGRDD